jgi:hypothetical protein
LTLAGATRKVPPGIVNNTLTAATKLIGDADLIPNIVGEKLDGQVVTVEPGEGTPLLKGDKVTIHMPNTPCTSPWCLKLYQDYRPRISRDAIRQLQ